MRICVFCGSKPGHSDLYSNAARQTGKILAELGIELVYGGAHIGLMGVLADAALAADGKVTGVMPREMVERMAAEGFLHPDHASMLVFDSDPAAIIEAFRRYSAPAAKFASIRWREPGG